MSIAPSHRTRTAWESWDPARWQPRAVLRRCIGWIGTSRRRRRIIWLPAVAALLLVLNGILGAVAMAQASSAATVAQPSTVAANVATTDGISWTNVRDSSGIALADYVFATNNGSVLNPGNTALSLVLGLEFTGFMVIVVTVIWLIGYALGFRWLELFDKALAGVADSLTSQIATPIMMAAAVAVGAFFVAWFIVRGFHVKAAIQVVTMLGVAVLGVTYLADPLADVLSPNGILAKGRNVGIVVAAGLNGKTEVDPEEVVESLEECLPTTLPDTPCRCGTSAM